MTMSKIARKNFFLNESRIWNLEKRAAGAASNMKPNRRSILFGYMWYDVYVESLLNIRRSSRNLATMWITEKNSFLREFSRYFHKDQRQDNFYSLRTWKWTVLYPAISSQLLFFGNKAGFVFVPKFFHEKRARNFLKHLEFIGEYGSDNVRCEYPEIGRKHYEYNKSTDTSAQSVLATDSDWPFSETHYKSIGSTVRPFGIFSQDLSDSLKNLIQPSPNLTNTESGIEEPFAVPTHHSFYSGQQQIEENIKNYNDDPVKCFINESYFLYDKNDLIKETYITALNKKISL